MTQRKDNLISLMYVYIYLKPGSDFYFGMAPTHSLGHPQFFHNL